MTQPRSPDPRALVLFCVFFSICAACLTSLPASLLALGIAMACALCRAKVILWRRVWAANMFILFIWLVIPWTTPGETVFQLGWFRISGPGLMLCLLATVKANALIIVFLAFVTPLPLPALDNALQRLHCPHKLFWLFLLMARNIHLLKSVWTSLASAAKLRGFRPKGNLYTYRVLAALLAILLLRAQERAERMHEAMLLRGFNGKLPIGPPLQYSLADFYLLLLLLFALTAMLFLEFYHG